MKELGKAVTAKEVERNKKRLWRLRWTKRKMKEKKVKVVGKRLAKVAVKEEQGKAVERKRRAEAVMVKVVERIRKSP